MLFAMGIAFLMLSYTTSITIVMISVSLIGFGQGALFPSITMKALNSVPLHQADKSIAIISSFIFLGQFISPLVLDGISKIVNQPSIRFQFAILSASIIISVTIGLFYRLKSKYDLSRTN